jgi:RNA polymerase-binding transcription factor DksA
MKPKTSVLKRSPRLKTPQPGAAGKPAGAIPAPWRWHYQVLQKLRDHLVDERAAGLAEAAEPIEPHSMDPADSATDEFDHALAVSLLSGEQDALYEVDAAMHRILDGTYGVCERTGRRIPGERLRAAPWTRFTAEAQRAIEAEGRFRPVRLAKAESIQGSTPASFEQAEEPEKDELQTRVARRHHIAESIKALEEGSALAVGPEPGPVQEEEMPAGKRVRATPPRTRGRKPARPSASRPRKRPRSR